MQQNREQRRRHRTEPAKQRHGEPTLAPRSEARLSPELLAPCLADLKRQLAIRQAMA